MYSNCENNKCLGPHFKVGSFKSSNEDPFDINLITNLRETNVLPNFSNIIIQDKLKLFELLQKNIITQKQFFIRNCQKVKENIDEQFQYFGILLRARQQALKNGLFNEAKKKVAAWDYQLSTCEAILQWLRSVDVTNDEASLQEIRNFLNTRLREDFNYIDSGDAQFVIGEQVINSSTLRLLRPLGNLGRILFSRDLKRIVPKLIIGKDGDREVQFCRPWGVCTDSSGFIFVSDRSNHRVQIFNEVGELYLQFGKEGSQPGEFNRPAGIAVNKKNEIIVSDKDNHRIQIFTYSGRFKRKFGSQGTKPGKFLYPWDVAVNSKFEIAVGDSKNHRVQLLNEFGRCLGIFDWRKIDPAQYKSWLRVFDCPRGLAFRPDDTLMVTDFNNHRVVVISDNLNSVRIIGCEGDKPGTFFRPQGITCDMYGRFAVADCKNYRVQVFDETNRVIRVFGCHGNAPGQFDCPQGISFHPNGSIVVVDSSNERIQIF